MTAAYVFVVASLVAATAAGYLIAFLFPGRVVEVGVITFALGMAWLHEALPWLEERIGGER